MKKLNDVALRLLAKAAYVNAKKEADSACLFIGYQLKVTAWASDGESRYGSD